MNALDDAAVSPRTTAPATPTRRVKAKVVLPIIAVLLALLGVGQMFATESLAIFAVGNDEAIYTAAPLAERLAGIHGREASRPTDPPPPTDPPQA